MHERGGEKNRGPVGDLSLFCCRLPVAAIAAGPVGLPVCRNRIFGELKRWHLLHCPCRNQYWIFEYVSINSAVGVIQPDRSDGEGEERR